MDGKADESYLVQVPAARGRVIPDMDSIREDLPALCEPITAIIGKSISVPTLDRDEDRRYALWTGSDRPLPMRWWRG
jgi:hypothetical protein